MNIRRERLVLSAIFLFCFAIRVAYIDQKNLWFDEVFSWHMSISSFYEIIVRTTNDIHPPLYYFILKIWDFLFGDSVFSMRLLSAICTSFAVFFIYGISKRFMKPALAFLPIILYCISPLNLYYSQEARMSGMNLLFNIAALYYFIRILENESSLRKFIRSPLLYVFIFFESAALYTHYFSFFILVAQLVFLIIHFRNNIRAYRPFAIAYSAVITIYLIWVPALIEHVKRGQAWREKQNLLQVSNEVVNFMKDVSMGLYYYYTNLNFVQILTWFLAALSVLLIILSFLKSKHKDKVNYSLLIGLALIIPLILASIISFNQKIEFYRYLSILVPYVCIMMVYLLDKIRFNTIAAALLILFASVNLFGVYLHYKFDFKNDDYRQIIKDINSNYKEGERIYVYPHYCGWIIDYTKKQENLKIPNFIDHRYGWDVLLDSLKTQNPSQFWVVMDYSDVDTSQFNQYVSDLKNTYHQTFLNNYPMAPARVEVYEFKR